MKNVISNNRPIGVSGLMRVKNEDEFVEASIDSVIYALDELIICYHESSDNTCKILEQKQRQFPKKIKLYNYPFKIYAHNLTWEEFNYAYNLSDDSPHLLSSYYNYTLSKATYKYAVKIDADQIYFKHAFTEICNAYRSKKKYRLNCLEKFAGNYFYSFCSQKFNSWDNFWGVLLANSGLFAYFYKHYILKTISNNKGYSWISGINLFYRDTKYEIPIFVINKNESEPIFIYNGALDHCFFEVTNETFYYPGRHFCTLNQNKTGRYSLIEAFNANNWRSSSVFVGFLWHHMRWCKKNNIFDKEIKSFPYKLLLELSSEELYCKDLFSVPESCMTFFCFYHDYLLNYQIKSDILL